MRKNHKAEHHQLRRESHLPLRDKHFPLKIITNLKMSKNLDFDYQNFKK